MTFLSVYSIKMSSQKKNFGDKEVDKKNLVRFCRFEQNSCFE